MLHLIAHFARAFADGANKLSAALIFEHFEPFKNLWVSRLVDKLNI
ncbi:MAG TPA: hypothetical protein VN785_07960 [Candidatus Angelobacter sp.]|nr:hypothetical protein [Candidatus Angelobacter sp.]